jgi:hypothetical protein
MYIGYFSSSVVPQKLMKVFKIMETVENSDTLFF